MWLSPKQAHWHRFVASQSYLSQKAECPPARSSALQQDLIHTTCSEFCWMRFDRRIGYATQPAHRVAQPVVLALCAPHIQLGGICVGHQHAGLLGALADLVDLHDMQTQSAITGLLGACPDVVDLKDAMQSATESVVGER